MNSDFPNKSNKILSTEYIKTKILRIRNKNAMIDRDLAMIYGVTTGNLNKAVKRNPERFPVYSKMNRPYI